jgi:hypothetical protein
MSFKLFIYYCAVCGGWAALAGWGLGLVLGGDFENPLLRVMIEGLCVGMLVALALGFVDILWNSAGRGMSQALLRGLVVAGIGCVSGLLGAAVGQALVLLAGWVAHRDIDILGVVGWVLSGLLIGASVGVYDWWQHRRHREAAAGAGRKIRNGVLGGLLGGLIGTTLYWALRLGLTTLLGRDNLLSSGAWGFVALGLCIGLFIGLAQVILKEAWVRVEEGFRAGRELILSKDEVTIGRAESCDIGLFGDAGVERTHARILVRNHRYMLADAGTDGGTFLNDQRIAQPTPLRDGDMIRLGKSRLRFGERRKRK